MIARLITYASIALLLASAAVAAESAARAAGPAHAVPFKVAVVGDGYATALAGGLRAGIGAEPAVAIEEATRARAGLAPGADDARALAAVALGSSPPDVVVVMLGASDTVAHPEGGQPAVDVGSPAWARSYAERVAALASVFSNSKVPVIWVGLPNMADDAAAAGAAAVNEAVRQESKAAGFRFVDSWDAFSDEAGRYAASGPDRNGHPARLRTADGRGLTRDGALKLASFVDGDLRRLWDATTARRSAADKLAAVSSGEPAFENDVGAQIRRELGLPATGPGRPEAAGPVVIVTAPPRAPGGQLLAASAGPAPLANAGETLVERTLVEGRPLAPKPGRIDDFSWPKR